MLGCGRSLAGGKVGQPRDLLRPQKIADLPPSRSSSLISTQRSGPWRFQDDRPQLVWVVDLLQVEHAGRGDRKDAGGGAYPVAQRGVGRQRAGRRARQPGRGSARTCPCRLPRPAPRPGSAPGSGRPRCRHHDPDVAVARRVRCGPLPVFPLASQGRLSCLAGTGRVCRCR